MPRCRTSILPPLVGPSFALVGYVGSLNCRFAGDCLTGGGHLFECLLSTHCGHKQMGLDRGS